MLGRIYLSLWIGPVCGGCHVAPVGGIGVGIGVGLVASILVAQAKATLDGVRVMGYFDIFLLRFNSLTLPVALTGAQTGGRVEGEGAEGGLGEIEGGPGGVRGRAGGRGEGQLILRM